MGNQIIKCPGCDSSYANIDYNGFCTKCGTHAIQNSSLLEVHRKSLKGKDSDIVSPVINERNTYPTEDPPSEYSADLIGGRYRVVSKIAEGGFGKTFLVEHSGFKDRMVLKQLINNAHNKTVELFEREAKIQRKLEIDGVPGVQDYFKEKNVFYIVQDYIEGATLRNILRQRKPTLDEILWVGESLLRIVTQLHQNRIIHRDIKPENIMLEGDFIKGKLYLIDFGACKVVNKGFEDENSTVIISAGYTAMEQKLGKVRFESDIYSIGMVLAEMLSGKVVTKIISNDGELIDSELPSANVSLKKSILKMVSFKNPEDRLEGVSIFNSECCESNIVSYAQYSTRIADATNILDSSIDVETVYKKNSEFKKKVKKLDSQDIDTNGFSKWVYILAGIMIWSIIAVAIFISVYK